MKQFPLRLRLFAASIISIAIALLIAGFSIATLFSNHVETTTTKDLIAQFDRIVTLIDPKSSPPALRAPLADPAFSKPYGGLYWQISDPKTGQKARSRSMWDEEFNLEDDSLLDGKLHITRLIDPEGTPAIAIVQRLSFELDDGSSRILDVIMAEDLNALYEANAKFRGDLAQSLILLALALSVAAWVQITLGLLPLSKIKTQVSAIKSGNKKRLDKDHPKEVMPLINEVNELLDTQEKYINYARERASNLAHGLKTLLSIMSSEANNIREKGNEESAKLIEQTGNDMQAIIDHQLRLSRLKTRSSSVNYKTPLLENINKIIQTISRSPKAEKIKWHTNIDAGLELNIDRADLLELLGIILENGAKWAKENIYITAKENKNNIIIIIEDDGKGVAQKQLKLLGKRGIRLDSKGSGTGIGLSIASEIVSMNLGELSFEKSGRGGLKLVIKLPKIVKQ